MGRKTSIRSIREYATGETLLTYEFDSALPTEGDLWYPEDMAIKPEAFICGLTEGEFGRLNALDLWLRLDTLGLMQTGLSCGDISSSFRKSLEKVPD
jgi:hypothetical protein